MALWPISSPYRDKQMRGHEHRGKQGHELRVREAMSCGLDVSVFVMSLDKIHIFFRLIGGVICESQRSKEMAEVVRTSLF